MFVDETLARRLESLDGAFAALIADAFAVEDAAAGRPAHAGSIRVAGAVVTWVAPHSVLSKVHGLGMAVTPTDGDLDAIEEFYRARGDRRVAIELAPFAGVELAARLEERGYRTAGLEHVLVRALDAGQRAAPAPPAGVTVEAVEARDAAARGAWVEVSAQGFFAPAMAPPDLVRYAALCLDIPGTTAWLARVDGAPAATGAHTVRDGLCALFGGATLPPARRRGAHRALIAARLADGARAGATVATAGASPGGISHRNLAAAGFSVAYTRPLLVRAWE